MSSKEIGIEQARKTLGDLALEAAAGTEIILTRGNSRRPLARIAPLETPVNCPVCGHTWKRPILELQMGMCGHCWQTVRHTLDREGASLCTGSFSEINGDADAPECPACAYTIQTDRELLRVEDMTLLGWICDPHPMHDHYTKDAWRTIFWSANRGRRLLRDGYITFDGDLPVPTTAGRELRAAYLGVGPRRGSKEHALAEALRVLGRAEDPSKTRSA